MCPVAKSLAGRPPESGRSEPSHAQNHNGDQALSRTMQQTNASSKGRRELFTWLGDRYLHGPRRVAHHKHHFGNVVLHVHRLHIERQTSVNLPFHLCQRCFPPALHDHVHHTTHFVGKRFELSAPPCISCQGVPKKVESENPTQPRGLKPQSLACFFLRSLHLLAMERCNEDHFNPFKMISSNLTGQALYTTCSMRN